MSNKLTITKTDGNIAYVTDVEDGVSGFLANGIDVLGGVQLGTVYKLRSLADVLALQIDEAYDTDNGILVYEHLKEAYRINATADIRFMLVSQATTYVEMVDPAQAANAKKLLLSEAGDIKMLFVAYNPAVAVGDYAATLAAITMAQTLYASEFAVKRDLHIFLEGKGFTKANATDFTALNCAQVNVQNGQALSVGVANATYAAIGVDMGVYSKNPVNESGAWVEKNNLLGGSLTEAAIGGVNIDTITDGEIGALEDNGAIYFKRQIPVSGLYLSGSNSCSDKENTDFYSAELNRTRNKVIYIMRKTITPSLSEPLKVDPDTGYLPPEKVMADQTALEKAVKDTMLVTDEISGISVRLNAFQNMTENSKRIIKYKLVPTSTGDEIEAEIGFASTL